MEELICGSAAYKIYCGDKQADRLSHAYMLYFADERNLRAALKLFALRFFGESADSRGGRLIESEGLRDMKIYPVAGGKLTADAAGEIVADAAVKPLEYPNKLYVISDFHTASPIFQNKLLKVLEEPPEGVYFLLGTVSLAPVLDTVISRVKTLEVPLFSAEDIYRALQRRGDNPLNKSAAEDCGGVLGVACDMLDGGWYSQTAEAAKEICAAGDCAAAVAAAGKYGDFKYKKELLSQMQREYFAQVKLYAGNPDYKGVLSARAATYAVEELNSAFADLRFNANFSSLLYAFLIGVAERNG